MMSDLLEIGKEYARGAQDLSDKYSKPQAQSPESVTTSRLLEVLSNYQECVRYMNTRRSAGPLISLDSEAAVQDVLYLMLRPWINDLVYENPSDKVGSRYAIADFVLPSSKMFVEAKFVRDKSHGKHISRELHDDIEMYRRHPLCDSLVFFIFDPDSFIADSTILRESIEVDRVIGGRSLECKVIVRP